MIELESFLTTKRLCSLGVSLPTTHSFIQYSCVPNKNVGKDFQVQLKLTKVMYPSSASISSPMGDRNRLHKLCCRRSCDFCLSSALRSFSFIYNLRTACILRENDVVCQLFQAFHFKCKQIGSKNKIPKTEA